MNASSDASNDDKIAYSKMLDGLTTEAPFQNFLEENSIHLPTPHLLNHDLVYGAVFPKVHLFANQCITDFTFATKSSVEFRFVHVELEFPNKPIFGVKNKKVVYSNQFLDAIFQVQDWQSRLEASAQDKAVLGPFYKDAMVHTKITRRFALVYGRTRELDTEHKRNLWLKKREETDIELMTADAIFNSGASRYRTSPNIFVRTQDQFRIKRLHSEPNGIFAHLTKDQLVLTAEQIEKLKAWEFSIDDWIAGRPLVVNDKKPWSDGSLKSMIESN